MVASPNEKTRLPLGKWRLVDYEIQRKDDSDNIWSVHAKPKPDSAVISVGRREREIKLGEPYLPTVVAKKLGGGKITMNFKLLGAGEEEATVSYTSSRGGRGQRPPAPIYKVVTSSGVQKPCRAPKSLPGLRFGM